MSSPFTRGAGAEVSIWGRGGEAGVRERVRRKASVPWAARERNARLKSGHRGRVPTKRARLKSGRSRGATRSVERDQGDDTHLCGF